MKHMQYLILFVLFPFLIFISLYSCLDNSFFYSSSADVIQSQREVLGVIKNGTFIEAETKLSFKLTNIGLLDELLPESGLLNLSNYEGKVIRVSNEKIDNEWIWDAKITELTDPMLTKIFKK